MTMLSRVKHILTERLDDSYAKTLCGQIILIPGPIKVVSDPTYFRYNHPDCQKCLRQYFSRINPSTRDK